MAQLSDTTNQTGLVQRAEFWSRLPYGTSGNALREIINNLNVGFELIIPMLLMFNDRVRWDDTNHTDRPIGKLTLTSGQADYTISEDDNALDILNITNVRILSSTTDTEYRELERMTMDDERALDAMSPNPSVLGVPSYFLENGNTIFLYPEPDYTIANGIQIFFQREQSYFTVTGTSGDDTTEPGIPKPFHELLALHAARMWVSVNRTEDGNLLSIISNEITKLEKNLKEFIAMRNPTRAKMTMAKINYI